MNRSIGIFHFIILLHIVFSLIFPVNQNLCFFFLSEQFIKLGAIERLSEYLEVPDEYCYLVETFLDALMILTEQEDVASEHLTGRLKDKLENIVNKTKGKPEFEVSFYLDIVYPIH